MSTLLQSYPVVADLLARNGWAAPAAIQVAGGTALFTENTPCQGFPLVLEGEVRVSRSSGDGRSLELYRVAPTTSTCGSYCCLLGPSGCGKTSTLRMIAGHEPPTAETSCWATATSPTARPGRRGTAMMFQSYALFPHLSVLDNVAFSAKMKGVAKAERQKQGAGAAGAGGTWALAARLPARCRAASSSGWRWRAR
jgi:ABC-type proline/glycine betaine transport system ATPase subunit